MKKTQNQQVTMCIKRYPKKKAFIYVTNAIKKQKLKQSWKKHTKSNHQGNTKQNKKYQTKRIKCQNCERQFNKKDTYEKHKNAEHNNINIKQSKITFQKKLRSYNTRNDLPVE